MKPEHHTIAEKWRNIKLSERARTRIEHELREYAAFHTAGKGVRVGEESRSIGREPQFVGISFITRLSNIRFRHMTALILIALLAGGGTSFAAERAVPGDTLYPIKVEVNEEVKGWLAFTNDAEARLHSRLMEERLEEAEALAAEGKLTADVASEISARMKAHAEEAEDRSAKAEAKGDLETAASVRASLQGLLASHARVLSGFSADTSNNGVSDLMQDIHAIATGDTEASVDANVEAEARAQVEATLDAAADILSEARDDFEDAQAELTTSVKANAEARLEEGARLYAEAEASLKANAYQSAYTTAQKVMRIAHEVRTMVKSALNFKVDLDTSVKNILDVDADTSVKSEGNGDKEKSTDTDANIDAETNTSVDTDILDTSVDTNSSVRIGL